VRAVGKHTWICRISHMSYSTFRNIGCDVRGDYKIFDFGLSKELKRGSCQLYAHSSVLVPD
jgi:hypothetical protein